MSAYKIGQRLTVGELQEISDEVDKINSEMDWRDENLEVSWFDWAIPRLEYLGSIVEASMRQSKINNLGLKLFQGGQHGRE